MTKKEIDPDLLTVEEAAPVLRVKEASVRHYVHTGALRPVEGLPRGPSASREPRSSGTCENVSRALASDAGPMERTEQPDMGYASRLVERSLWLLAFRAVGFLFQLTIAAPIAALWHDSPSRVPPQGDREEHPGTVAIQWWSVVGVYLGILPLLGAWVLPVPGVTQGFALLAAWLLTRRLCAQQGLILNARAIKATVASFGRWVGLGLVGVLALSGVVMLTALMSDAPTSTGYALAWAWAVAVGALVGLRARKIIGAYVGQARQLQMQLAAVLGVSVEEVAPRVSASGLGTADVRIEVCPLPERAATSLSSGRVRSALLDAMPDLQVIHLSPEALALVAASPAELQRREMLAKTGGLVVSMVPSKSAIEMLPDRLPESLAA